MRYFPLSKDSRQKMLSSIGVEDVLELYQDLPKEILNKSNIS